MVCDSILRSAEDVRNQRIQQYTFGRESSGALYCNSSVGAWEKAEPPPVEGTFHEFQFSSEMKRSSLTES